MFHRVLLTGFATTALALVAHAQPGPRSVWNIAERGGFVMSSLRDQSDIPWFGTEDRGVWRYDPSLPQGQAWHQFTTKDGLGDDNVYALAQDEKGRVWAGHQSHGVSVWNGRAWRNYDITSGPLGERVFDIKVSPLDGSVWIATNRGLAIYDAKAVACRCLPLLAAAWFKRPLNFCFCWFAVFRATLIISFFFHRFTSNCAVVSSRS